MQSHVLNFLPFLPIITGFFSTVLAKILFATVKTQPWYVVKFEQPEVRELKMILSGQNEIYRSLKTLVVKLDEIVGRQERELSLLTTISQQQHQAAPPSDRNQVSIKICALSSRPSMPTHDATTSHQC